MTTSCLFRVEEREIGRCSMGIRVDFLGAVKKFASRSMLLYR